MEWCVPWTRQDDVDEEIGVMKMIAKKDGGFTGCVDIQGLDTGRLVF